MSPMLLYVLYFKANPSSVSLAPVPFEYVNKLFPKKSLEGYVVVSLILTPLLSYNSNKGYWFTFVFSCDAIQLVPSQ